MTAAAEPVLAAVAPIPPVRLTASTIDDDALDALYAERDRLLRQLDFLREVSRKQGVRLHAEVERLTVLTGKYADRAIANGQCAEQAEDAIERVCEVAERWERYGSADLKRYAAILRAALDGPSEPRPAPTAALVSPVGLRGAPGATGGLG